MSRPGNESRSPGDLVRAHSMDGAELLRLASRCAARYAGARHFEEVQQEAALAGWRALSRFDETKNDSVRAFVWQAMTFAALDYYRTAMWRKRDRRGTGVQRGALLSLDAARDAMVWDESSTEDGYGAAEARVMLAQVRTRMEAGQFDLLWRHYAQGVSQEDIGASLGVSGPTISRRIAAARAQAAKILGL